MTRLRSLIKEVLSQEPPYYIIQSLKTGSPKYIFSIEGEKPSWVSDNRIEQAHRFATLEDAKNYLSKFDTKRTEFWHIYKRPSGDIGLGPDLKESKKDCNCGCGGCEKKAPIITEGRIKKAISEGLTYHVENKIPLHKSVYRIGSEKHFELINEARKLWVRGLIDVSEDDQAILETNLGHFGMYEGEAVPLDMPMVNEETVDWPKVVSSRYGEYKFVLDKVMSDRAKYKVVDVETGKEEPGGRVYGSPSQLQAAADDLIKPSGGRQSSQFEESLNEEAKMPSQEEVDKFFSITQNEMHYLNSKPVMGQKGDRVRNEIEPWDEYDLSNWNALVRKAKAQGKINEGFYSSPSDLEDSGLNVIPKDQIHANKLKDALENSGLYGEWNPREGYFFFPEEEDGYDQLEMEIQELMDDYNIQGYIEGVFEESLNEVEIGDRVKIDKNYGGGRGIVDDKVGGYVIINGKSYHESDVKVINPVNEANLDDELKSKRKKIELEYGPRTYKALQIALMKGEDGKVAKILDTLNEENKPSRIDSLIKLVKSAKNPRNLPISFGTTSVAIGGTQYDKGELVDMFNGRELGMDSIDIRKVFYNAQQDAEAIADEVNASNSGIEATIGYGYGKRPILYLKKSSLNEVHKLLRQTNLSSEEYQKAKKLKGFNADDYTFSSDNNLYVKKESVDEVDRYSGFNRNPEDPDSVPFEPKGSVAQFKEDLRALFGKFKGDLKNPEFIKGVAQIMVNWKSLLRSQLDEAKKKSKSKKKDPPLNKPKRGGSKAYYVYVRDPKTKKIKKVSFGSGGLRAKIKNKEARNAFAARHNCKNKKDRTKAGYWSCNLPRYAEQLGLGSNMNTFW